MIPHAGPILCVIFGSILALIDLSLLFWAIRGVDGSPRVAAFGLIRMIGQAICLAALIGPFGPLGLVSALIAWSLSRAICLHHASREI